MSMSSLDASPTTTASSSSSSSSSLPEINRVDLEERFLAPNQSPLAMATPEERQQSLRFARDEAAREAAAFERATPRRFRDLDHSYDPTLDDAGFGAVVVEHGVARVDNVLAAATADSLLSYVNQQLLDSLEEVANYRATQGMRFGNVLAKKSRWDLLLPFDDHDDSESACIMMDALDELIGTNSMLGSIIDATIGKDAELYELGALISDPGSERQEIHPDIEYQEALIPLVTCFVALQDVDASMGPTVFLPRTHNDVSAHDKINDLALADSFLQAAPSRLSLLNKGDASIFNPSTLHAGGANRSTTNNNNNNNCSRRVLLYITFRNVAFPDPSTDFNPGSIRPELKRRRLTLSEMRMALHTRKIGNEAGNNQA